MLIVSYDFSNDKLRSRFSKHLEKYGRRIQYSVFEIRNSQRVLQNILHEIQSIFKKQVEETDSVWIWQMCERDKKGVRRYGYAANEEKDVVVV